MTYTALFLFLVKEEEFEEMNDDIGNEEFSEKESEEGVACVV